MRPIMIGTLAALLTLAPGASALNYRTDKPLAFTYQNNAGWWFGCGPTQCIQAGEKTEDAAFYYLQHEKSQGPWHFIGRYGQCNVYQGDGDPNSYWGFSVEQIVSRIQDKC